MRRGSFRSSLLMFLATMADIYNEVSYSQVYNRLRWPGYKELSVRGMVRRMLDDEELVQVKDGFKLGKRGYHLVDDFVRVRKYQRRKWDGWWRVIIYDIPEKDKVRRNSLRMVLTKYGYGLWQKSVYLTPHPVTKAVTDWLNKHGMASRVVCLESRQVGGLDNRQIAAQVFQSKERLRTWEYLVGQGYQVLRENRGSKSWVDKYEEALYREPWLPQGLEMPGVEIARHKAAIIMQKLVS